MGGVQARCLVGYSDLAGDVDLRKSTSGILYFLGSSPVTWQSLKQKVVALSSCESEYVAAVTAACQGIWLARLLAEFSNGEAEHVVLKVDNKSAIALAKNLVFHERSKHIDLKYHFIRDCAEAKKVELEFVPTEHQLADMLTKPLDESAWWSCAQGSAWWRCLRNSSLGSDCWNRLVCPVDFPAGGSRIYIGCRLRGLSQVEEVFDSGACPESKHSPGSSGASTFVL